jgi:hypothetical protein
MMNKPHTRLLITTIRIDLQRMMYLNITVQPVEMGLEGKNSALRAIEAKTLQDYIYWRSFRPNSGETGVLARPQGAHSRYHSKKIVPVGKRKQG